MAAILVHPDIFDICFSETDRKTTSPWLVEKCISSELSSLPSRIRSVNLITFADTVASPAQGQILLRMTSLHDRPITVASSTRGICHRGLTYIYDYPQLEAGSRYKETRASLREPQQWPNIHN